MLANTAAQFRQALGMSRGRQAVPAVQITTKSFGELTIPSDPKTLTASYTSANWRDGERLTFFNLSGRTETPFFPGFRIDGVLQF
jgi:hypothetical protein